MFPWVEYISGLSIRQFMIDNVDYCAYLSFLYLGMIYYGPGIAKSLLGRKNSSGSAPSAPAAANGKRPPPPKDPSWLRVCMIVWNFLLSAFSFFGSLVMLPSLFSAVKAYGWHSTVCTARDELVYTTPCGFWVGVFVLSKVPELIDTLWLVLQKQKTPPFLHWYHHVSVLIFAWTSYTMGNSTMIVFGSMNIFVHAIMYFYFFLCACGFKKMVRPIAPLITGLQIAQMVGGTILTCYSYAVNASSYRAGVNDVTQLPCAVPKGVSRFGALIYISYLYLFSKMFVNSYLRKPEPRPPREAQEGAEPAKAQKAA